MRSLCGILILLTVIGCSGCKSTPPAKTSQTGNDISRIGVRGDNIVQDADALRPNVLPAGLPLLNRIIAGAQAIVLDVATAQKNHAKDTEVIDWYAKHSAQSDQALDDERDRLFSHKQRLMGWTLAAIGAATVVGLVVAGHLGILSGIGGLFGGAFRWLRGGTS